MASLHESYTEKMIKLGENAAKLNEEAYLKHVQEKLDTEMYGIPTNEQKINAYMAAIQQSEKATVGVKYDFDKPKWSLLPWDEVEDVVKVLTFGAKKYAPDNWKFVDEANSRYLDAAMRHLVAHQQGECFDSESDERHIAHAVCCLLFMMWHHKNDDAS